MTRLLRTQHGVVLDVSELMAIDPQEARNEYWLAAVMKSGDDFMLMKPTSDIELRTKVFENIVAYWAINDPKADSHLLSVRDILDGKLDPKPDPKPDPKWSSRSGLPKPRGIIHSSAGPYPTISGAPELIEPAEPDHPDHPDHPEKLEGDHQCAWYAATKSSTSRTPTSWACRTHGTVIRRHPMQNCDTPECCGDPEPF